MHRYILPAVLAAALTLSLTAHFAPAAYFPLTKILDSGGTNQLGVDASGRVTTNQGIGNGTNTSANLIENGCAGQTIANTNVTAINNAASSTNLKLITKASSKQVYICAIHVVAAAATNVALVEGTKTTNECDTSTAGLAGGSTAGTGWNITGNGLAVGTGVGLIARTATTNHDVCLLFSAGNQVSGSVTWAQF